MKQAILDKFRASPWLLATIPAAVAVALIAPYQLGVLVWSLCKLTLGAYLGYWIDRTIFPYARPGHAFDEGRHADGASASLRRAVIMAATILALGSGV